MTLAHHHLKPLFYRSVALLVLLVSCITILAAQQDTGGIAAILKTNLLLSEQLGLLGPVAISPYWGLFLASLASLFDIGNNEYLMTHPMLGNWVVLILFGICAVFTSVPNITKYSKALGVASNYLEDHVSIIIVVLAVALPIIHQGMGEPTPDYGQFGILSMSFYSIMMIAFSAMYMFVVTTVRLFFEVTAFITPIPLVDIVVEIMKKISSMVLMAVYFVSPEIAFGISLLMLLIAFFLYKKASTRMNYFKHFYISPIISWIIGRKRSLLDKGVVQKMKSEQADATIPVWPIKSYGSIKKQKLTWVVEEGDGEVYLYQSKILKRFSRERVVLDNVKLRKDFNYLTILDHDVENDSQLHLRITREYFPYTEDIAQIYGIEQSLMGDNTEEKSGTFWQKIKRYFSSNHLSVDTEISG